MVPKGHKYLCGCFACKAHRNLDKRHAEVRLPHNPNPPVIKTPVPDTFAGLRRTYVDLDRFTKRIFAAVGEHDNRLDALEKKAENPRLDESCDFPVKGCDCERCERIRKDHPGNPETDIGVQAHKAASGPTGKSLGIRCEVCQSDRWSVKAGIYWCDSCGAEITDAPGYKAVPLEGYRDPQHADPERPPVEHCGCRHCQGKEDQAPPNCWCGQTPNVEPDGSLWCPTHKGKTWTPAEWQKYVTEPPKSRDKNHMDFIQAPDQDPDCDCSHCKEDRGEDKPRNDGYKVIKVEVPEEFSVDSLFKRDAFDHPQDCGCVDCSTARKRRNGDAECPGNPFYCACTQHQDAREAMGLKRITKSPKETLQQVAIVLGLQTERMDQARNDIAMSGRDYSEKATAMEDILDAKAGVRSLSKRIFGLIPAKDGNEAHGEAPTSDEKRTEVSAPISEGSSQQARRGELWGHTYITGWDKPRQDPGNHDADKAPVRGCACKYCQEYRHRLNIGYGTVKEYAGKAAIQLYYERETLLKARNNSTGEMYERFNDAYNRLDTLRLDLQRMAQSYDGGEHWGNENPDLIRMHLARTAPIRGCTCRHCKGYRERYAKDKKHHIPFDQREKNQ